MQDPALVHYIPIGTTLIAVAFLVVLAFRSQRKGWSPQMLWWAIGVATYGLGTAFEGTITLFGNSPALNTGWYWAGAILGGYPLATGTVYLLMKRRTANILTAVTMVFIVFASIAVFLSPVNMANLEGHRPGGAALEWRWVRLCTPFINGYAALFLIGGAIYSCIQFLGTWPRRALGTALIAVGALLPGIGGGMAKGGIVEALYIGEFVGLILIWIGYEQCIVPRPHASAEPAPDR